MKPRGMVRLVVAVSAAALVLSACTGDSPADAEPVAPGEVVTAAQPREVFGHPVTMMLPGRRYTITVTPPLDEMDSESATASGHAPEPPEGHAFVGVSWTHEPALGRGWEVTEFKDTPATVTLRVDGEELEVGDLAASSEGHSEGSHSGVWVTVPDDAREASLEVAYDGLTQTAGDVWNALDNRGDGPFTLYERAPHSVDHFVESPLLDPDDPYRWLGPDVHLRATTGLPWMQELGWAPKGSLWLPVAVWVSNNPLVDYLGSGDTSYVVEAKDVSVRLAGRKPVETFPATSRTGPSVGPSLGAFVAVFEVEEGYGRLQDIVVRRTYVATAEGDRDPAAPRRSTRTAVVRVKAPGY